jgi:hypothetical protein
MCASQSASALGRVVEFKELRRSKIGTVYSMTQWSQEDGTVLLEGTLCVRLGEIVAFELQQWQDRTLW